jgi:hypothetical protein
MIITTLLLPLGHIPFTSASAAAGAAASRAVARGLGGGGSAGVVGEGGRWWSDEEGARGERVE